MRSILILAALTISSSLILAQAPPIKMGLWEKKMVISNGTGAPNTMTMKSCINPAAWQEMVAQLSKQREGCTTNISKNPHGYTYNGSCTAHGTTMVLNGTLTIQDDQHIVAESHSTTTTTSGKKGQMDSHSTSTFLSADCGHIKPGEPE